MTRIEDIATARAMSDRGISQRQIAAQLGCSQASVYRMLKFGRRRPEFANIAPGEQFGQLTALRASEDSRSEISCLCDCGTEVRVQARNLRSGNSASCGSCWRAGSGNGRYRHGMAATKIYAIWADMIGRCMRPTHLRYADYGGRGITVCERWRDFVAFYEGMGDRPADRSLDRIDNDKGYSPDNCRWATAAEQRGNRRPQRPRKRTQMGVSA